MSFHLEFVATMSDASKIIAQENIPDSVKAFMQQALSAFNPDTLVQVKASGHLFNSDYKVSNAELRVTELSMRLPRPEPVAEVAAPTAPAAGDPVVQGGGGGAGTAGSGVAVGAGG